MILKQADFGWGGLNTRANSTGLPLLECVTLQDLRVVGRDLVQRKGISRVAQLTGNASALDFDGANQYLAAAIDTRVWALGLYWTVEFAIELDTASGTQGIVTAGHTTPAMIFDVTGGNIRARVWDSAGTSTSITVGAAAAAVQTVQLTRSGATLSAKLNNGTAVTGSMSSTLSVRTPVGDLRIARDDGTNYFDGTIDHLRLFSIVKTDHKDRLIRHPNPRAEYVLADYDLKKFGTLIYDRSRYENTLVASNTPTEIASLCHNPAPIRGISMSNNTTTNRKELLVLAGGSYYIAGID